MSASDPGHGHCRPLDTGVAPLGVGLRDDEPGLSQLRNSDFVRQALWNDRASLIRLVASPSDHGFIFTLARGSTLLLTTGNRHEAADRMLAMGIEVPDQLLDAAERWGVVEIWEEQNPDWRGG